LLCPAGGGRADGVGEGGVSAGSGRAGRIEGWSDAPIASRLPAVLLVAAIGLGAVVRPAAPFVFIGLFTLYLVARRRGDRSAAFTTALAAVLPAAAIPTMVAMILVGYVGGVIARRTAR
jgi:hypothetical protein